MKRREFIALLGGVAAAWPPLAVRAQRSDRTARVGVLMGIGEGDPEAGPRVEALEQGFYELGWIKGRNLQLDYRWTAGDPDRALLFAKEIVELKPDLIVVHSTPAVKALRQLTTTIPMVFVLVADPIGSGFVQNLSHPGRQHYRLHECRFSDDQQMAGANRRDSAEHQTSCLDL
jgi:putative ABC transport system substrate-binding protein